MKIILSRQRRQSGFIWFVVGLLVLLLAIFIVYELIKFANRYLPPPPPPGGETNNAAAPFHTRALLPLGEATNAVFQGVRNASLFTLQYGVGAADDGSGALGFWVRPGTNLVPSTIEDRSQSVVLWRSTGLTWWEPVLVDECKVGDVRTWTDSNAPPGGAFYQLWY